MPYFSMGLLHYILPVSFGSICAFFRYFTLKEIEADKKIFIQKIKDLENVQELTIDQLSEESNQKEFLDKKEIFLKGKIGNKIKIAGMDFDANS